MNSKLSKIPKIVLITKLECAPCKGAKFILQKLRAKYDLEIESILLNAANKQEIYEKYNIDDIKIPSVFVGDKLVSFGKVEESEIKSELDKYVKL